MATKTNSVENSLETRIHQAFRYWHDPARNDGVLTDLLVLADPAPSAPLDPRTRTNDFLRAALQRLALDQPDDAEMLTARFIDRTPADQVALRLKFAESTIFMKQNQAIKRLAKVVAELEADAWRDRHRRVDDRIPVPATTDPVGHAAHIAHLVELLRRADTPWIISIEGIGGIGKTTLACAYANQDDRFKLKLYASLGQNYRENLESSVMETWIGGTFAPGTRLEQMIAYTRQHLMNDGCGTPVLLLIDDVWADTVNAARYLRAAAPPNARVLITTRSEDVAAALDADSTRLDALSPDEGADLMLDLIRDKRAEATRADLKAISTLLAGHSLALTLAARQLRRNFQTRRVKELKDMLETGLRDGDAFPDLKLERADAASKQDSVSLTLKLTLDALHADDPDLHEKRLKQFRALGALPPDLAFRAKHVYAIWGEDDADALDDFAAEGLITADETRDDWYTQHRLLRAYARAQLRELGELDEIEANHRQYLIDLAYDTFNRKPPETWWDLTDDLEQIHALGNTLAARLAGTSDPAAQDVILHRMSEAHQEDDAVGARHALPLPANEPDSLPDDPALLTACDDFAAAVNSYIFGRYVGAEGRRWLWAGLAAARARESQSRIRLFSGELGLWHDNRGLKRDAIAYHEQSLTAARAQGDKLNEATALSNIGLVWQNLGEKQKALDYYEQSLPLKRAIDDKRGEANTLNNIGSVWLALGDYQKALDFFQQALPLRREVGDKRGEATTLHNIGAVWWGLGDQHKALNYYEQALPLRREVGDKGGEAATLNNIGSVWLALGDYQKALDFFEQALPLRREVGDKGGEATTLHEIGLAWRKLGDNAKALDFYRQALPLRREVGDKRGEAATLNNIGMVWRQLGDNAKALDFYRQALPLCRQVGDIQQEAITLSNIAIILWEQGDRATALGYMQTARAIKLRIGVSSQIEDDWLNQWRSEMGGE